VGVAGTAVAAGVSAVAVTVGDSAVAVTVGDSDVAVGVGVRASSHTLEMRLVSIVTAPFLANALPSMSAPVFRVMLVSARILPANAVSVPRVAELPTCQNTLQGSALLSMLTDELLAVVSVLPIRKTKTASGSPSASSSSTPVSCADVSKQ
jgi:hypothetical protein